MRNVMLAIAGVMAVGSTAQAQTLAMPSSFYVDGTSSTGYTLNFSNVSTNSVLSFSATGTPTLQSSPNIYGTNAAGVVTVAGTTGVGGSSTDPDSGFTFGSLILSLNGSNAQQVFATNAANGLGSSSPPTTLSYSDTLADLFHLSSGVILNSAAINFKVDDNYYADNTSGFTVTATPGTVSAIPEPAVWGMMVLGSGTIGLALRRRKKVTARVSVA